MIDADPLLSVSQVARLYGTGQETVIDLVKRGVLPSLDGGTLIDKGRIDVPVIRLSWVTALQGDETPGSSRVLEADGDFHPAFLTAFAFHAAVDIEDEATVASLSSTGTRNARSDSEVLALWRAELKDTFGESSGVGTAIYSLAPIDAVTARILAGPPGLPRVNEQSTPTLLLGVLPMVQESSEWRVDLPLFRDRLNWLHLLTEPLPDKA
jgi:hypothetical protein